MKRRRRFKESAVGIAKRKFRPAQLESMMSVFKRECSKFISANKFTLEHLDAVFTFKKMELKLVGAVDSNFYVFEDQAEGGFHYIIDRRQIQDYFLGQIDPDHKPNWVNHKYTGGRI